MSSNDFQNINLKQKAYCDIPCLKSIQQLDTLGAFSRLFQLLELFFHIKSSQEIQLIEHRKAELLCESEVDAKGLAT